MIYYNCIRHALLNRPAHLHRCAPRMLHTARTGSRKISVACPAETYLGPHQPELLQIVAHGPLAHPQSGRQLVQAAGILHPDEPVHPVDPFYIVDC